MNEVDIDVVVRGCSEELFYVSTDSPPDDLLSDGLLTVEFVQRCQKTRKLTLDGRFGPNHSVLLQEVLNFRLRHLRLNLGSINTILVFYGLPGTEKLSISGLSWEESCNDCDKGFSMHERMKIVLQDLNRTLPPSKWHTGRTTLHLSRPNAPPAVIRCLLLWPALLEELQLDCLTGLFPEMRWTTAEFESLFRIHPNSPKKIHINKLPCTAKYIPDFWSLPHLEHLQLVAHDISKDSPLNAVRKLAAPNLRRLTMDYGFGLGANVNPALFGSCHLRWLKEFISMLASELQMHILRRIRILYTPDPPTPGKGALTAWPWRRLDEAIKAASFCGIYLTCSKPTLTKQQWEMIAAMGIPRARVFDEDDELILETESQK
ncbi:hypothetical protein AJ79_08486 [Helicocarpus griseus UAMH5409]|uniref:F-box domain-containing protein n=1 Tax=Helicocarpus griseus UAMH5409 TaxID=1447875 RepID=A0A2B7WSI9_9EURO|nr:hypothetical protein AJ79_08486 [Helicocarpus griseus UAMH5409]